MKDKVQNRYFYNEATEYSKYCLDRYAILGAILFLAFIIRIWGIENIGLHGDEVTTAMPALEILNTGQPRMPSGMFYGRALIHSCLVAISVWIFGISEWAIRVPSVVAGTTVVFLGFLLGKRFLPERWNLLFAIILALHPWLIVHSKIARMYIFFSAAIVFFAICIYEWGKKDNWICFFIAILAYCLSLSFHSLSVFSSFLFFVPYILKPSFKRMIMSIFGFIICVTLFLIESNIMNLLYGTIVKVQAEKTKIGILEDVIKHFNFVYFALASLVIILLSLIEFKKTKSHSNIVEAFLHAGFTLLTFACGIFFEFHIAIISFVILTIIILRKGSGFSKLIILYFNFVLLLTFQIIIIFHLEKADTISGILKILVGSFSLNGYINFFKNFPLAVVFYLIIILSGVKDFIRRQKLPEHYLLFAVGVWIPLFMLNYFARDLFDRYSFQLATFFCLSSVAGYRKLTQRFYNNKILSIKRTKTLSALFLIYVFVQPTLFLDVLKPSYKNYPDHKGAASFMKNMNTESDYIIIAENVLQQVFYGTPVKYWLRGKNDAIALCKEINGKHYDIYTNTELIGTGDQLKELIESSYGKTIFVIGSGETFDYQNYYLSNGILPILNKYKEKSEIVYSGVDNKTKIYKINF